MKSNRIGSAIIFSLVLGFGTWVSAQTSPWPFPSRPGVTPAAAPVVASGRAVTVAYWNIAWFPGRRPDATHGEEMKQINAVHKDIVKLQADVIGMAEVRDWQSAELAVKPLRDFKVDVCATFPPREGQNEAQQVAIASRLPAISAWAEMWKPGAGVLPPRGFAFAAYEVAPRQLLLVYAVHFKSNLGEPSENFPIREESQRQLMAHIAAMQNAYGKLGTITWIIGGDFNTSMDDKRFVQEKTLSAVLANGFNWTWQNIPLAQRTTLPPDKTFPAACFDHIFYKGAILKRAWVGDTWPNASDHRAIAATFNLPAAR